jgi:hypothetical protein
VRAPLPAARPRAHGFPSRSSSTAFSAGAAAAVTGLTLACRLTVATPLDYKLGVKSNEESSMDSRRGALGAEHSPPPDRRAGARRANRERPAYAEER